ncbi:hypothetical protein F4782DRAFT_506842 [Xylaria castorea]|nr:hypothetical protein F4782DRAFT_506842 [Xylaria castorea]
MYKSGYTFIHLGFWLLGSVGNPIRGTALNGLAFYSGVPMKSRPGSGSEASREASHPNQSSEIQITNRKTL